MSLWRRHGDVPAMPAPVPVVDFPFPGRLIELHDAWVAAKADSDSRYEAWCEAAHSAKVAENALLKARDAPQKPAKPRKGR